MQCSATDGLGQCPLRTYNTVYCDYHTGAKTTSFRRMQVNVRLSEDLVDRIRHIAQDRGQTIQECVERTLKEALGG